MHFDKWELKNCKGIQESPHECTWQAKSSGKKLVKRLCGCESVLLQCHLVFWMTYMLKTIKPPLNDNKPVKCAKYFAYTEHTCANRNQPYQWEHIIQSILRQILDQDALLPHFCLTRTSNLDPGLLQKLQEIVKNEHNYEFDNLEELQLNRK